MNRYIKISLTLLFTTILLLGFALPLNQVGNWYQQFMPNINGASIKDITFTDSLNGYSVTSIGGSNSYVLKTTNSGDNWSIKFMHTQPFVRVEFINSNTGFANAFQTIFKTTNAGENWTPINLPGIFGDDMFVLNDSTIWLAMSESLTGGVFRTTNGGANWEQQLNIGSQNPTNIYMYNKDTGFTAENVLYKTTNSGVNWVQFPAGGGFSDMYFVNALTGWKCAGYMQKTTDGGLNWVNQVLPTGGNIIFSAIDNFSVLGIDTVIGVGGNIFLPGQGNRGIIFRTINGGNNWLYQVPDTAIHIGRYLYTQFIGNKNGWAYTSIPTGIHTTTGGDPVWLTGIEQISSQVPKEFMLYQNYPNPFNPVTNIKYSVKRETSNVKLIIFDITGREIVTLVNKEQTAGTYLVDFSGNGYSSGTYFYSLMIDGTVIQTRKMILIK